MFSSSAGNNIICKLCKEKCNNKPSFLVAGNSAFRDGDETGKGEFDLSDDQGNGSGISVMFQDFEHYPSSGDEVKVLCIWLNFK